MTQNIIFLLQRGISELDKINITIKEKNPKRYAEMLVKEMEKEQREKDLKERD